MEGSKARLRQCRRPSGMGIGASSLVRGLQM
uniref:Uncharacterized protein n=1 Tax=Arundo donax TaxID=35708 RepID=A0A0A9FGY7_ARUDO